MYSLYHEDDYDLIESSRMSSAFYHRHCEKVIGAKNDIIIFSNIIELK